jgi:hypothetical protein
MKIDAITKSVAEAISKVVDESLKGDQHKIDANKNNKIDAHDFKLLRSKKKVEEETVEEANDPSVKVPVKGGMRVYGGAPGGSAKAYKSQTADPFSATRGPSNTELDDVESEKKKIKKEESVYKHRLLSMVAESKAFDQELNEVISKNADASAWIHDFVHSDNPKFEGKSVKKRQQMALAAYYAKQRKEEVEIEEDSEQLDELSVNKMLTYRSKATEKLGSGTSSQDVKRKEGIRVSGEKVKAKVTGMKREDVDLEEAKDPATSAGVGADLPFDTPYNTSSSPAIKDKSGAIHTPMSRAKHLARTAMKKISKDLANK